MKRSVMALRDFSGGYATDIPPELMPDNMLEAAENCYWDNALQKRGGAAALYNTPYTIRGRIRVYWNGEWVTVVALETGFVYFFTVDDSGSFSNIDSSYSFTGGHDVEMAELNGQIVAVNGVDKPALLYYDSGAQVVDLEAFDSRQRDNIDWYAGQADPTPTFTNDTTDAQDAGAGDFEVMNASGGSGFYVGGVVRFNKIVLKNCEAAGDPEPVCEYYGRSGWTTITPLTAPDFTAAGDKTFEFDLPFTTVNGERVFDWVLYDGGADESYTNRYVIRILFNSPPGVRSADSLEVHHTQYLTDIMRGDIPHGVCEHGGRIFLAAGINVNYSPYGSVTGWYEYGTEYFSKGGPRILKMLTHKDYLLVVKGAYLYALRGTSYENWVVEPLAPIGTVSAKSVAAVAQEVYFLGPDSVIYGWDGANYIKLTKHIRSDIASFTQTNATGALYMGRYYIAFPDDSVILWFDPDTIRKDGEGDGVVSVWKYTGVSAQWMGWQNGSGDNRKFVAVGDSGIIELENGNPYDGSGTAIAMSATTKEYSLGAFLTHKSVGRVKPEVTASGSWTFTMYADHAARSMSQTLRSGTGGGFYSEDISLPYTMDGKTLQFQLANSTTNEATIYGLAFDAVARRF
jgi:hypothetical protein